MEEKNQNIKFEDGCYKCYGAISEQTDFTLLWETTLDPILIDLDQVNRINSYSLKNLVRLLKHHKNRQIKFQNCPVFIIDQFNLFTRLFSDNVQISSFYIPLQCFKCDKNYDSSHTLQSKDVDTEGLEEYIKNLNQKFKCQDCSSLISFYKQEIYFKFLKP